MMIRRRRVMRAGAGMCAVGAAAIAIASPPAHGQPAHHQPQSQTIEVWMAGHPQAAQRFVDAVSTPGSASFHHFLSPDAYTRRFGPSGSAVRAVRTYLRHAGFADIRVSAERDYVSAVAPAATVRNAFASDRMTAQAGTLTVPAPIRRDVLGITGLDNGAADTGTASPVDASSPASAKDPCTRYWGQKIEPVNPAYDGLTEAALAPCGYSAKQIRGAYDMSGEASSGKGRTIALIEIGGPDDMFRALTDYARTNGLPKPGAKQFDEVQVGQGDTNPKCLNGAGEEASLDSEAAYAMAPGADQLMVDGDDCDTADRGAQALVDAMLVPLTAHGKHPSATVESVSYGVSYSTEAKTPPAVTKAIHAVALRAAAEGVSLLLASGDSPGIDPPDADPDVTSVGGTTLGIGADDQRLFETGWSTDFGERVGSTNPWSDEGILLAGSGGTSAIWPEPAYQKGVVPAVMAQNAAGTAARTVPDLAAVGDPYTGMLFGIITVLRDGKALPYATFHQAGTSTATPLVAGIVADAEQGQSETLGFLNPLLYKLAGSTAFYDALPMSASDPATDRAFITTGDTDIDNHFHPGYLVGINDAQDQPGTTQVTAPGYDTMTGLGSPNGAVLIRELRSGK